LIVREGEGGLVRPAQDDELMPRESGLALFDAFASREKSLHANPGRHAEVPMFEVESSLSFFGRHLSPGDFPGGG
jgi:hypothetical protein